MTARARTRSTCKTEAVPLLLVRHARAGNRSKWRGDDRLRPLTRKGTRQAEGLVGLLDQLGPERILSSPFVRQTIDWEDGCGQCEAAPEPPRTR